MALHDAENRWIASEEAKFVSGDRQKKDSQNWFVQELNDATEYQHYLKEAEKEKKKADHEGYLKYCAQLDNRKQQAEE